MRHFWVVGTDTDVGKTMVTTMLMCHLQRQGLQVTPYKPVQTGEVYENGHGYYHDTAMYEKHSLQKLQKEHINSYSLKEAASPHYAAKLEGQSIDVKELLQQIQFLQDAYDIVICEGLVGSLFLSLLQMVRLCLMLLSVASCQSCWSQGHHLGRSITHC